MSEYFQKLQGNVRSRYQDKLKIVNYIDPYTLQKSDCSTNLETLPPIEMIDIVNYFVLTHSFYTGQQLKSYKSLEAYRYCKAGFVTNICYVKINNNFIITGEVRHSEKMNEKTLKPWLILLPDSAIHCAHCDCMAGLGEVCSHVAAIAFYLFRLNASSESVSCTSKLSTWPVPEYTKNVTPLKIKNIDWGKKTKSYNDAQKLDIPPLAGEDLHKFLREVEKYVPDAVIFSVMEPYAQSRIPEPIQYLPKALSDFYDPDLYQDDSLEELRCVYFPDLSSDEIELVQRETIKQNTSRAWFNCRAGRITASLFKLVCKTSIDKPSLSLVKRICYPLKMTFKTNALVYGQNNESFALEAYERYIAPQHVNFLTSSVGLCISKKCSFIAATPDAMVKCDCCGIGCVEVKCPYRMLDSKIDIKKFAEIDDSCLVLLENGSCALDQNHNYFYQVQLQMYVTETKYCDFIVWSKQQSFVQRIYYEASFIQNNVEVAKLFFSNVIVPELLVRWYTKSIYSVEPEILCECQGIDDGRKLLRCANEPCLTKWFHYQCVNKKKIKITDDTYWFCKTCSLNIFGSEEE